MPLDIVHHFRVTPFLPRHTLRLEQEHLIWQKGKRLKKIALADILSLRLQSRIHEGYLLHLCDVKTSSGRYRLYDVERARLFSRQQKTHADSATSFAILVSALAEQTQKTRPEVQFLQGISSSMMLINKLVFVLALLVIVVGLGMMLWHWTLALAPLLMISAVILFLPALYAEIRQGRAKVLALEEFLAAVEKSRSDWK